MRIACLGGGPAGLYFSILMKKAFPETSIRVHERNRADDTFGWGVVFSDETLGHFERADPESFAEIRRHFAYWTDIETYFRGTVVRSTGHGFCGLARKKLLQIFHDRCRELGVELHFESDIKDDSEVADADLVLAADGINSFVRAKYADHFRPTLDWRRCKFTWLGTNKPLSAFTFVFRENDHGLFQVHAYPFEKNLSTWIVECHEDTWRKAGLEHADEQRTLAYCRELFSDHLDGYELMGNRSIWRTFPTVRNERWQRGNVVLVGDAAHTAHFSIGSGTKLAMEDSIALCAAFQTHGTSDVPRALAAYEAARRLDVLKTQKAAQTSLEWFENSARYMRQDPLTFTFNLMSRSKRITYDNLGKRDPELVRRVTEAFGAANGLASAMSTSPSEAIAARTSPSADTAARTSPSAATAARTSPSADTAARTSPSAAIAPSLPSSNSLSVAGDPQRAASTPVPPPLFAPFQMRSLRLENRVVVSPMCQYSAVEGVPTDWHLVHLGSRAVGGAGLVIAEMTNVSIEGRITYGCAGLWNEQQRHAWQRTVSFVHEHSRSKIGIQLAHAGRKASCHLPWEGDRPLRDASAWMAIGASADAFGPEWPTPRAMDSAEIARIRDAFVASTRLAASAGFDLIELHMAHGYLLSSFLSPLANRRDDQYGGSLENRMRYPLEVFDAVRAAWPAAKPISVRISASDWLDEEGGWTIEDSIVFARELRARGCDLIDVSSAGNTPRSKPEYGRMYQVPFAERIRHEALIPVMAVGAIQGADHVNTVLAAGRADLCALARPHLAHPYLVLDAATTYGQDDQPWPNQYLAVKPRPRASSAEEL